MVFSGLALFILRVRPATTTFDVFQADLKSGTNNLEHKQRIRKIIPRNWVVWATTTGTREPVRANTVSMQTVTRTVNKLRSTSTSEEDDVDLFSTQQFSFSQQLCPQRRCDDVFFVGDPNKTSHCVDGWLKYHHLRQIITTWKETLDQNIFSTL